MKFSQEDAGLGFESHQSLEYDLSITQLIIYLSLIISFLNTLILPIKPALGGLGLSFFFPWSQLIREWTTSTGLIRYKHTLLFADVTASKALVLIETSLFARGGSSITICGFLEKW